MIRTLLGGLAGGLALYVVGFIFWATPLGNLAYSNLQHGKSAAVQQALAAHLTESGTGTYAIPSPGTSEGTTLYGRGPVAMVHFNMQGFPVVDSGALLTGLVLAIVAATVIAFGLRAAAPIATNFADRMRLVVAFSVALPFYIHFAQPVFNHTPWPYFIYSFIASMLGFIAAGFVIARWFMPERRLPE